MSICGCITVCFGLYLVRDLPKNSTLNSGKKLDEIILAYRYFRSCYKTQYVAVQARGNPN